MTTTDSKRRQARSGAAIRVALAKKPGRVMQEINGWQLCVSEAVDYANVYSEVEARRVTIDEDTWFTLCASAEGSQHFFAHFLRGEQAPGLANLSGIDWWMRAQRTEAAKASKGVVTGKDEFTQLEEELRQLITAASGFADGTTDVTHLKSFFGQLVVARGKLEGFRDRFDELEGTLDLAETVVAALR